MKLLIGEKIPNFWPIFRAYPTYGPFALDIPHTRDRTLTSKDDNVSGVIFPISYRLYESVWSNYFAFMIVHFQRKSFSIKKNHLNKSKSLGIVYYQLWDRISEKMPACSPPKLPLFRIQNPGAHEFKYKLWTITYG